MELNLESCCRDITVCAVSFYFNITIGVTEKQHKMHEPQNVLYQVSALIKVVNNIELEVS